jgi:hypothetical protein
VCDLVAKPTPEPAQTDLWAVPDPLDDTRWHNMVPGWVPADCAVGCWQVGQVELVYPREEHGPPVCYPNDGALDGCAQ